MATRHDRGGHVRTGRRHQPELSLLEDDRPVVEEQPKQRFEQCSAPRRRVCWACAPIVSPACGTGRRQAARSMPRRRAVRAARYPCRWTAGTTIGRRGFGFASTDESRVYLLMTPDLSASASGRSAMREITVAAARPQRSAGCPMAVTVVSADRASAARYRPAATTGPCAGPRAESLRWLLLFVAVRLTRHGTASASAPFPAAGLADRRGDSTRRGGARHPRHAPCAALLGPRRSVIVQHELASAGGRLADVVGNERAVWRVRRSLVAPRRFGLAQLVEEVGVAQREQPRPGSVSACGVTLAQRASSRRGRTRRARTCRRPDRSRASERRGRAPASSGCRP